MVVVRLSLLRTIDAEYHPRVPPATGTGPEARHHLAALKLPAPTIPLGRGGASLVGVLGCGLGVPPPLRRSRADHGPPALVIGAAPAVESGSPIGGGPRSLRQAQRSSAAPRRSPRLAGPIKAGRRSPRRPARRFMTGEDPPGARGTGEDRTGAGWITAEDRVDASTDLRPHIPGPSPRPLPRSSAACPGGNELNRRSRARCAEGVTGHGGREVPARRGTHYLTRRASRAADRRR